MELYLLYSLFEIEELNWVFGSIVRDQGVFKQERDGRRLYKVDSFWRRVIWPRCLEGEGTDHPDVEPEYQYKREDE